MCNKICLHIISFVLCIVFLGSCGSNSSGLSENSNSFSFGSDNGQLNLTLPDSFKDVWNKDLAKEGYGSFYIDDESGRPIGVIFDQDIIGSYIEVLNSSLGYQTTEYEVCGDKNAKLVSNSIIDTYFVVLTIGTDEAIPQSLYSKKKYLVEFNNHPDIGVQHAYFTLDEVKAILDTCPDSEFAGS